MHLRVSRLRMLLWWRWGLALVWLLGLTLASSSPAWAQQTNIMGAVRGNVFVDLDGDAQLDEGELAIINARLRLYDADGAFITMAATNLSGEYAFLGLLTPATYTIKQDPIAGYVSTTGFEVQVTLSVNQTKTVNFGNRIAERITGRVFIDRNRNGEPEAEEPGVAEVVVHVLSGSDTVEIVETDSQGYYSVTLPAGSYTLVFQLPDGYTPMGSTRLQVTLRPAQVQVTNLGVSIAGQTVFVPHLAHTVIAQ